jgi:hypothetical protein
MLSRRKRGQIQMRWPCRAPIAGRRGVIFFGSQFCSLFFADSRRFGSVTLKSNLQRCCKFSILQSKSNLKALDAIWKWTPSKQSRSLHSCIGCFRLLLTPNCIYLNCDIFLNAICRLNRCTVGVRNSSRGSVGQLRRSEI